MSKALLLENISLETLNSANQYALSQLEGDSCVQFTSANSMWVGAGFSTLDSFNNVARVSYRAEVKSVNLGTLEGVGQVNAWVNAKTKGKISKFLDAPTPENDLLLLNATYFKGLWSKPFKKEDTQSKPFFLQDGSSKSVQMMSQKLEKVDYVDAPTFEGVRLSYKSSGGRAFVTELYLPKKTSSLSSLTIRASGGGLDRLNWEKGTGILELPRFKMEGKTDLEPLLSKMGMGVAFTDGANFSKLSLQPTKVSGVLQKAVLEVNEEGAEAAAATGVLMQTTSVALPPRAFNLILNRPFFMTIREQSTNTPLFVGAIYNPDSK
jgi:serine protease inhibitor